jgi:hypothetical protein
MNGDIASHKMHRTHRTMCWARIPFVTFVAEKNYAIFLIYET